MLAKYVAEFRQLWKRRRGLTPRRYHVGYSGSGGARHPDACWRSGERQAPPGPIDGLGLWGHVEGRTYTCGGPCKEWRPMAYESGRHLALNACGHWHTCLQPQLPLGVALTDFYS